MTAKPKTRKVLAANGAKLDPVFGAIAEHKVLSKETGRLQAAMGVARDRAEKKHGKSMEVAALIIAAAEDTKAEYDQFICAAEAENKAAMRMARTPPASLGGMAAMIFHVRSALKTDPEVDWEDWAPLALKTVAAALSRLEA